MKNKTKDILVGLGFILLALLIVGVIGNATYCTVAYWNTPYLQVPMHCHFSSK